MTSKDAARDYSQSGEQASILRVADTLPVGRFLDIGAGDGETFSNTRALALRGWGGVCVEPAAWAFDKLVTLYFGSIVGCCSAVVTRDYSGLKTFLYSQDDHVSTVEPAHAAVWARDVPYKPVTVAAVTLTQLLDWCEGAFSIVSIDAEGLSLELLDAYQEHPAWEKVRCVCVEGKVPEVLPLMATSGLWQLAASTANNVVMAR